MPGSGTASHPPSHPHRLFGGLLHPGSCNGTLEASAACTVPRPAPTDHPRCDPYPTQRTRTPSVSDLTGALEAASGLSPPGVPRASTAAVDAKRRTLALCTLHVKGAGSSPSEGKAGLCDPRQMLPLPPTRPYAICSSHPRALAGPEPRALPPHECHSVRACRRLAHTRAFTQGPSHGALPQAHRDRAAFAEQGPLL